MIILFVFWAIQYFLSRAINKKRNESKWIYLLATILLVSFVGINIYFAKSSWVAIYKWIKVGEFVLIGLFVARAKDFKFNSWIAKPLSFSLIVVSVIAFIQFALQRTVGGPLFLLGERSFTAITPGIATFTLFGRELLRPYSVFPHPNVMAGFLGTSFYLLLLGLNKRQKPSYYKLSLVIILLTLILSLSQGAWTSFVLVGLVYIFSKRSKNISKRVFILGLVLIVATSLFLPAVSDKLLSSRDYIETVNHRLQLAQASGKLIAERPIVGVGEGNFILGLIENSSFPKYSWCLQPAHNIFLLTFSETGFIGLGLFVLLLLIVVNKIILKKERKLLMAFLFVILTGFLDHYWITLQQTQILFAILIGLAFRKKG
jgi:O-antigen ligase